MGPNHPPANLLEMQASLPDTRGYFTAVDRYAAALSGMHDTYRNGEQIDLAQQQLVANARDQLNAVVAMRALDRVPEALREAEAAAGAPLTPAEQDAVRDQCAMDEISLSIISTAISQAEMAPAQVAQRGNAVTRGLARVLGNRWTRAALYTAAGVGIVGGILSGAGLAVAIGAGVGGVTSPIMRRIVGHFQGRGDAHAARNSRNVRDAVEERNHTLLSNMQVSVAGETPTQFMNRVHGDLYRSAEGARQQNRQELRDMAAQRRRRGVRGTFVDIGRGMLMGGGFAGLIHGAENFGHFFEGADVPPITPDQAAHAEASLIRDALASGDPSQLQAMPGLEHADLHTLKELAAQDGGRYAWDGLRHIYEHAGVDASDSAIQEGLNSGVSAVKSAHADGLGITARQVFQPDGDWFFKINVTDPHGLVVLQPDAAGAYDVIPLAHGSIHGASQAQLFDALNHGGQLMTVDQAVRTLGESAHVTPEWLADQLGRTAEGAWNIWTQGDYNLARDIALGAAGGVAEGATSQLDQRRRQPGAAAMAAATRVELRSQRTPAVVAYLSRPATSTFVLALPPANQMAFARMINGMTAVPRAQIGGLLNMDPALIAQLQLEDEA